jgi:hypothetical protein
VECETETGDQGGRVAQSGVRVLAEVRAAEAASAVSAVSASAVASTGITASEAGTGREAMRRSGRSARWADPAR